MESGTKTVGTRGKTPTVVNARWWISGVPDDQLDWEIQHARCIAAVSNKVRYGAYFASVIAVYRAEKRTRAARTGSAA